VGGVLLMSKVTILDDMFAKVSIDVVGVQEGRSRTSGKRNGVHYEMFIARGTAQGQYGSQVWVAKKLGFRFQHELAVSPRIMSVTGTMRG
jgi:hypothetical protein